MKSDSESHAKSISVYSFLLISLAILCCLGLGLMFFFLIFRGGAYVVKGGLEDVREIVVMSKQITALVHHPVQSDYFPEITYFSAAIVPRHAVSPEGMLYEVGVPVQLQQEYDPLGTTNNIRLTPAEARLRAIMKEQRRAGIVPLGEFPQ